MQEGFLVLISGPSGSGKSTICRKLRQRDRTLKYSVSCTTRERRPGERNGKHYFFVSPAEFRRLRRQGAFLESAGVHGCSYGTPRKAIEREIRTGNVVLLDIDVVGAELIRRRRRGRDVSIFVLPPSWEALRKRLRGRRDTDDTMRTRLANARRECRRAKDYTYWAVNDRLETAVEQIEAILLAERLKPRRHALAGTKLARIVRS